MPRYNLSLNDQYTILAHYDSGRGTRALAAAYDVDESTVLRIVRRHGGTPRRRGRPSAEPFSAAQKFDIFRRHYAGEAVAAIARDHAVTPSMLWHYLESRGKLRRRARGRQRAA